MRSRSETFKIVARLAFASVVCATVVVMVLSLIDYCFGRVAKTCVEIAIVAAIFGVIWCSVRDEDEDES